MGKTTIALATLGTIAIVALLGLNMKQGSSYLQNGRFEHEFRKYLARQGKSYATKEEYDARYMVFEENFMNVLKHNQKNSGSYATVNFMSDLTYEERKRYTGYVGKKKPPVYEGLNALEAGSSVNWVKAGKVNPVQNQG